MDPLLPHELAAVLAATKAAARGQFGDRLQRTVLFGSYATGRVHEESDVDVLVEVDPREPGDRHRAADAAVEVMMREPRAVVSLLVLTPGELSGLRQSERRLARDIDAQGIVF